MTATDRSYALQDAADRWQPGYEGSISKEELLRQAAVWEAIVAESVDEGGEEEAI